MNFKRIATLTKRHFAISLSIIAAVSAVSLCALSASGCKTNFYYDNSSKYSFGSVELPSYSVKQVNIEWLGGEVDVSFTGGLDAHVSVSETANKDLDDYNTLHYWLDGDVLKIKFAASGRSNYNGLSKSLKVVLPSSMTLSDLTVTGVSSNIVISGARSDTIYVSAVSGNVEARGVRASERLSISTTSGNVNGNILTSCNELSIVTTSGNIGFSTEARVMSMIAETTSGNIFLSNMNPPKKAVVDTVSGNVELEFLDNAGFEIAFSSVSGDFETDFKTYIDGNKYVCGIPNSSFSVKTVSGDVKVTSVPT